MASVKLQTIVVLFYFLGIHFSWYSVVGKSPSILTRGARRWESLSPIRTKKQTNECSSYQWTCEDRSCISIDGSCDGLRECDDGSDETEKACGGSACPGFLFRCTYGACVDGDAPCNGVMDCADGSDEDLSLCTQPGVMSTPIDRINETNVTPFPFMIPSIVQVSTPPPPPPPITTHRPPSELIFVPTTRRQSRPPPSTRLPGTTTRLLPPPPTYRPIPNLSPTYPQRPSLSPPQTNQVNLITGYDSPQPSAPRVGGSAAVVGSGSYSSQQESNAYIGTPSSDENEPPSQIASSQASAGAQSFAGSYGASISGGSGSSSYQGQTSGSGGYSLPVAAFGQSSGHGHFANDYNTFGDLPIPVRWDSKRNFCLLPSYPINGYYVAVSGGFPGEIQTYIDLSYSCDDGYNVVGASRNTCFDGSWDYEHPVCERMCKPLPTRHAECSGFKNRCDLPQNSKTVALVTCRNEFHFPVLTMALNCINGKWDNEIPKCAREDAGKVQGPGKMLIKAENAGVRTSNEGGGNYIITIMEGPLLLRIEASHGIDKNITENINVEKQ